VEIQAVEELGGLHGTVAYPVDGAQDHVVGVSGEDGAQVLTEEVRFTALQPDVDAYPAVQPGPAVLNAPPVFIGPEVAVPVVQRVHVHVVGQGNLRHPPVNGRLANGLRRSLAIKGKTGMDV
jgi:hypothetical protein